MPTATETIFEPVPPAKQAIPSYKPLKPNGVLERYSSARVTPNLGTEFHDVNLKDWITGPDSDAHIRDLGILISRRGVVAFRNQVDLTPDLQKELGLRLCRLTGQPEGTGLYKHPMHRIRGDDPVLSTLNPKTQRGTHVTDKKVVKQSSTNEWHSDVSAEPAPSSYTILKMTDAPSCGGDTMFCDSYGLYEKLSAPYQRFFESLRGWHDIPAFRRLRDHYGSNSEFYRGERGSPANTDDEWRHLHPIVRTNPVTGWKALFAGGIFFSGVDEFSDEEDEDFKRKINNLMCYNHDLQLRFHWNGPGDVGTCRSIYVCLVPANLPMAIWDNRSVMHAATPDYSYDHEVFGLRRGKRVVCIGEVPFLDPLSTSRAQDLGSDNYV